MTWTQTSEAGADPENCFGHTGLESVSTTKRDAEGRGWGREGTPSGPTRGLESLLSFPNVVCGREPLMILGHYYTQFCSCMF